MISLALAPAVPGGISIGKPTITGFAMSPCGSINASLACGSTRLSKQSEKSNPRCLVDVPRSRGGPLGGFNDWRERGGVGIEGGHRGV